MKVLEAHKIRHQDIVHRKVGSGPLEFARKSDSKPICQIYPWQDPSGPKKTNISVILDGYANREDLAAVIGSLIVQWMNSDDDFRDVMLQGVQ